MRANHADGSCAVAFSRGGYRCSAAHMRSPRPFARDPVCSEQHPWSWAPRTASDQKAVQHAHMLLHRAGNRFLPLSRGVCDDGLHKVAMEAG